MFVSIRSALLVLAALSASSVAPAQVRSAPEPLIPVTSATLPVTVEPQPLVIERSEPQSDSVEIDDDAPAIKPQGISQAWLRNCAAPMPAAASWSA
ncbi:hypothetical protein G7077_07170 [Sphingomonas piscis]|uniref:Uncharacterized protein n=1 Tax=Sphingomonas piscis TaxID=2714943 RepID=A0A6G7YPN4_9SPHN|nr:hypothetical protein [Sphingomonas piscis]QIK78708.1 hypothetical protein G7077_07170 [Sphingomonas piscis]